MKRGKILLGVLGGLAAGALLGILLAPDSGANTRKKIVKKGEDYVDDVKGKFSELVDDVNQRFDNLMKEANAVVKRGKEKANSMMEEARS